MRINVILPFIVFVSTVPVLSAQKMEDDPQSIEYVTRISAPGKLEIVRQPYSADLSKMRGRDRLTDLPKNNPNSSESWQVDVRSCDLSGLQLENRLADLLYADFDSRTMWPRSLPEGFDPLKIFRLGKNPGLNIRKLHEKGITGKDVGVAVIDQALLTGHMEYRDRLRLYEEIHWIKTDPYAQMHGPAVASIAVGKNVGVASGADLYFIACWMGDGNALDYVARCIDRIVSVNRLLPSWKKIRVISISLGWESNAKGLDSVRKAIERAKAENIVTLHVGSHGFLGMGRKPLNDPDSVLSFESGWFWKNQSPSGNALLIPMDSRCVAGPTGTGDYAFYRTGGMSWVVPYLAGLYALACQVRSSVTFEEFWDALEKSSMPLKEGDRMIGKTINPERMIEFVKMKD
jgi:hypothetical protein